MYAFAKIVQRWRIPRDCRVGGVDEEPIALGTVHPVGRRNPELPRAGDAVTGQSVGSPPVLRAGWLRCACVKRSQLGFPPPPGSMSHPVGFASGAIGRRWDASGRLSARASSRPPKHAGTPGQVRGAAGTLPTRLRQFRLSDSSSPGTAAHLWRVPPPRAGPASGAAPPPAAARRPLQPPAARLPGRRGAGGRARPPRLRPPAGGGAPAPCERAAAAAVAEAGARPFPVRGGGGRWRPGGPLRSPSARLCPRRLRLLPPAPPLSPPSRTASSSPGRGAAAAALAEPDSCAFSRQESGKMAGAEAGMSGAGIPQQPQPQPPAAAGPADESSDSEGEHEGPQKLIRKVSTSGQIRSKVRGAGAGEPRCLRGKFLHPHPGAGAARSRGRPLHPARIPGSGGGGRGRAVRRPCLFLPSLSPPPRPAVASTSVPVWQEEPPGAAQLRGAGGEAACPGSRPALPGVLGVGGSGGAASPPAPLPRRRAPLPRGSRPASQRGGGCFSQPFLTNFPFPRLPCPLIFFPPGPGGAAAVRSAVPHRVASHSGAGAPRGKERGFQFERHLTGRERTALHPPGWRGWRGKAAVKMSG